MWKKTMAAAILLLTSFQISQASINKVQHAPDSVYLFSYATTHDDGRSGLRFAYSIDQKNWLEVGRNYGYVRCDYGRWGSQKKMLDPILKQMPNGEWYCTWKLNERDGYGHVSSKDLLYWGRQSYNSTNPLVNEKKVTAFVAGKEETGSLNRTAWSVIEGLIKTYEANQYRNELHGELMEQDGTRFAGLKPLSAILTAQPEQSKPISELLVGIFFEDINYAADGGLYAELIQNRDFEYALSDKEGHDKNWNSSHSWKLVITNQASKETANDATFTIDTAVPLHPNNPHYALLSVSTAANAALINEGFDGIALKKGERYDFSLFGKVVKGKEGKLRIRLLGKEQQVLGETTIYVGSKAWKQSKAVLIAKADAADATLSIEPQEAGSYALDLISLFPQKTFKNRKNGLRADLAQTLADMHPRFMRFPGGCVAHGDGIDNIYRWKNTIGPLEARKPQRNLWGYHQTAGLGYYEYFQFCEDIGAEPLPVLAAGVPCQNSAHTATCKGGQQGGIPMNEMGAYVQEILDLIEWANGDAKTTKWGKVRAQAGHPKPFNLKYIGIGNEDLITDIFEERFTLIFNAIKEKYPEIVVIGNTGPAAEGTDYTEGWNLATKLNVPIVDEHYYQPPGWFIHNQEYYDKYSRNKSKVYLGEYASHVPGRKTNMETALSEALYMTALERNGDIVSMSSYAPLLAKEKRTQWNPNLIYFNNQEVKPTTGYYVQQLYGQNAGDTYIGSQLSVNNDNDGVKKRVAVSIVKDSRTNDIIVKLVNLLPVSVDTKVKLSGMGIFSGVAIRTVLSGRPTDKPLPITDTMQVSDCFDYQIPPYSFTVIRIKGSL